MALKVPKVALKGTSDTIAQVVQNKFYCLELRLLKQEEYKNYRIHEVEVFLQLSWSKESMGVAPFLS